MAEPAADQPVGPAEARKPWLRPEVRYTISAVVLLFIFEYLLLPEIASARKNVKVLSQVNVWLLVLAIALEFGALLAYAELSRTVFAPDSPRRWTMLRINMSSLAVSHVVPGGTAAGGALGYRLLTADGVPGSTAAFGLATQGVGSAVVLNIIFWLSLFVSIPLNGVNPLYGYAALLGVLLLAAFGGTVLLLTRGQRHADGWLRRVAKHVPFLSPDKVSALLQQLADRLTILFSNRSLLGRALLWAAANWILDAACLWVILIAFGQTVMPIDLLVAYGLANILAAIPLTPGGLGVVELTLSGALAGFGVPTSIAYLSVIAWRLVNFWLPIPLGGASYLSLRIGNRRRAPRLPEVGQASESTRSRASAEAASLSSCCSLRSPAVDRRLQRRSGPSSHVLVSSRKVNLMISTSRSRSRGSSMGTTASMRRSRFRSIMSADPMRTSVPPSSPARPKQ